MDHRPRPAGGEPLPALRRRDSGRRLVRGPGSRAARHRARPGGLQLPLPRAPLLAQDRRGRARVRPPALRRGGRRDQRPRSLDARCQGPVRRERAALPPARAGREGLRHLDALPGRAGDELERGRPAHPGLRGGGDPRQPLLHILYAGRSPGGTAGARAAARRRGGDRLRGDLGRAQGREPALGQRLHGGHKGRGGQPRGRGQGPARPDRGQARGGRAQAQRQGPGRQPQRRRHNRPQRAGRSHRLRQPRLHGDDGLRPRGGRSGRGRLAGSSSATTEGTGPSSTTSLRSRPSSTRGGGPSASSGS